MSVTAMKNASLLACSVICCYGAITNQRVLGTTATQAVLAYTAPDTNACTMQVSQNPTYTPLVLDVDPNTFANSNSDLSRSSTIAAGRSRVLVIGQRTAQYATAGPYSGIRHYSRALEAYSLYYYQITCGSDTVSGTFNTTNIPMGNSYGEPYLSDPSHPGEQPWPEFLGLSAPRDSFIDPLTGLYLQAVTLRGNNISGGSQNNVYTAYNQGQTPCDAGDGSTTWVTPCNAIADDANSTRIGANTSAWLVLRSISQGTASYDNQLGSLDQLSVTIKGAITSADPASRVLDVGLSLNGGASYTGALQQITLDQVYSTAKVVGQADITKFGILPWLLDTNPRINNQEIQDHSGRVNVSGNTVTYTTSTDGRGHNDPFSLYWVTGGNGTIRLSTTTDACIDPPNATTAMEYTITGFIDGNNLTVSGTPPTGNGLYYCVHPFAIMIRRHDPGSGVDPASVASIQYTSWAKTTSWSPAVPTNASELVSTVNTFPDGSGNQGWWSLFGNLFWQNAAGDVYTVGDVQLRAHGGTNGWQGATCPSGNGSAFDTRPTMTYPTWYCVANDYNTGEATVVMMQYKAGVFQPTTPRNGGAGNQINNWTTTTNTTYGMQWGTPSQRDLIDATVLSPPSLGMNIEAQLSAFLAVRGRTYSNASHFHWLQNVGFDGSVFYFFMSGGSDQPGWVIAFDTGDQNPDHAGQVGGPRIIGAVNSFDADPAAAYPANWHVLHGCNSTGNGYVNCATNTWPGRITTNTDFPATSVDCSTYGLAAGKQCQLVTVNAVSGSYEPYLVNPSGGWSTAPGTLHISHEGDVACVKSGIGACNWSLNDEGIRLVVKGYGGDPSQMVFQRNVVNPAKQKALSCTSGCTIEYSSPICDLNQNLDWASCSLSNQAGNTTQPFMWHPASDPYGLAMTWDTNAGGGHLYYRSESGSYVMSAAGGAMPFWDGISNWVSAYQAIPGEAPGFFQMPYSGWKYGTPGINYINFAPAFAGGDIPDGGVNSESHVSPPGSNAGAYEQAQAFDNRSFQGGGAAPAGFVNVTGQLYVKTGINVIDPDDLGGPMGGGNVLRVLNRKLTGTAASSGSHPLIDVSGPSSVIASDASGSYTYCIPRVANECRSGSTVGSIYVNAPGVRYLNCSSTGGPVGQQVGNANDICIHNSGTTDQTVVQFHINKPDVSGAGMRQLLSAVGTTRMVGTFSTFRLSPDGKWGFHIINYPNRNRNADLWMAKMPPWPAWDSVVRTQFVPVVVSLTPPSGTDNAIVEFGYQEFGAPGRLNCTTRNDPCEANAAAIPSGNSPFKFLSESPSGVACSTGCAITIPALPQHVLFWRVKYRNSTGMVVHTGPVSVMVP